MSSIPLPALDVKPPVPSQANPLQQYAELMGLRNEMQNAPLQREALQNQVQAGQQENQQRQLQLQDQQNLRSAAKNVDWTQSDAFDKFLNGAQQSGVSPMTLSQLSMQRQQYLKSVADTDVATNTANLANNNTLLGHIETLEGITDPVKRAEAAKTIGQQILSEGSTKNPQILQTAQGMASGQLVPADEQLDSFKAGLLDHKTVLGDAVKNQQIQTSQTQQQAAQANTQKTQAETQYYQQNGGAPGVPAETMELNSYLKNNPGKTPQDFLLWKLQHTTTATVMGNQLGGAQNQQALDFAAQNYRQTGQMPPGLYRSPGTITAVIQRAAQLDQQQGGQGLAENSAEYKANETSLKSLQKNYDQVQAFEGTAQKNMNLLSQTLQSIPDLGAKFANVPVRAITGNMIGTANMAKFQTALYTTQTEAAKVLNSSNASGVLSDNARHELQAIIDPNATVPAIMASIKTLNQEFGNRTQAYQLQIGDIQNRIKGPGGAQPQGQPGPQPNGDPFANFGGKAH